MAKGLRTGGEEILADGADERFEHVPDGLGRAPAEAATAAVVTGAPGTTGEFELAGARRAAWLTRGWPT